MLLRGEHELLRELRLLRFHVSVLCKLLLEGHSDELLLRSNSCQQVPTVAIAASIFVL